MARSLQIRKPGGREVHKMHALLEQKLGPRQHRCVRRFCCTYAAGMEVVDIARALASHINTVYLDLRAFERDGIVCLFHCLRGGAIQASLRVSDIGRFI